MTGRGPLLGTGAVAEVFAWGEHALKLYLPGIDKVPAFREAAILASLERLGLPAPRAQGVLAEDGRWGVLMTQVSGAPLAELVLADPARGPEVMDTVARLHARIHACPGAGLPRLRDRLLDNIARAPGLQPALRARLLAQAAAADYGDRLCHGDFHPFNVLGAADGPVVVDWLDAHEGDPAADICRSYVLLRPRRPGLAEAMLAATAAVEGLAVADILAWTPLVAAARLAETVGDDAPMLLEMAAGEGRTENGVE